MQTFVARHHPNRMPEPTPGVSTKSIRGGCPLGGSRRARESRPCAELLGGSMTRALALLFLLVLLWTAAPAAASTTIDYGPISHKGLKKLGGASSKTKLTLQLGLFSNQSGLQKVVKSASNPSSSSYGKYTSLSTLQSKYGASSSARNGVIKEFKAQGILVKIDVTHLRAFATVSVGKAQKMFGTAWKVYKTSSGSKVALPVDTPKLPSGIKGNADTVAGMRE